MDVHRGSPLPADRPDGGDSRARQHHGGHDQEHGHDHTGGRLRRWLGPLWPGGHHHQASDRLDSQLEGSAEGIRALKLSLLGLGITAGLQAGVVLISGSVALLGDTLHNVADALTAVPLWLAFVVGRRPPNRRYTYGYGRAEDLAGVLIVVVIAASAVLVAWESVDRLLDPRPVSHLWSVMAAAVIGFAGNEIVARYRITVGRRIGSAALVADGLHARTDGLTSLAVLFGAIGVALGWRAADPAVGLVIAVAIAAVLRSAAVDVWRRLMDAVDPDLVANAEAVVRGVDGVEGVESVRLRWIGHRLRAEVGIVVDARRSIVEAHDVAVRTHHELLHEVPRLDAALIHVSPCRHDGVDHHADLDHHRTRG